MTELATFAMFMDNFGVVCFTFIIGYSGYHIWKNHKKNKPFDIPTFILLCIGLGGLIVDGYIVGNTILNPVTWFKKPSLAQGVILHTDFILLYTSLMIVTLCGVAIYFLTRKNGKKR